MPEVFGVAELPRNGEQRTEVRGGEFRHEFLSRIRFRPKASREVAVEAARVPAPMRVLVKARRVVMRRALEPCGLGQGDEVEAGRVERPVPAVEDLRVDPPEERFHLFEGFGERLRGRKRGQAFRQVRRLFDIRNVPK